VKDWVVILNHISGVGVICCLGDMIDDALVITVNCSSGIMVVDDWVLGDVSV